MAGMYDDLGVVEKAQVNGYILDLLDGSAHELTEEALTGLRRLSDRAIDVTGKSQGFQVVLGEMREVLAANYDVLPELEKNGIDDTRDLGAQIERLRSIGDVIDKENADRQYHDPQTFAALVQSPTNIDATGNEFMPMLNNLVEEIAEKRGVDIVSQTITNDAMEDAVNKAVKQCSPSGLQKLVSAEMDEACVFQALEEGTKNFAVSNEKLEEMVKAAQERS